MSAAPQLPSTAVMRQCAESHRTVAGMYRLDPDPDAEVTADASMVTALLLEAAADWIDHQSTVTHAPIVSSPCGCAYSIEDMMQVTVCAEHQKVPA